MIPVPNADWIRTLRRTKTAARFRRGRAHLFMRLYHLSRNLQSTRASALILAICLGAAFAMQWHLNGLTRDQDIRLAADAVSTALTEIETEQRGYLLSGDPTYLANYQYYRRVLGSRLEVLCLKIPRTADNDKLCHELNLLMAEKLDEMQQTVLLVEHAHPADAMAIFRSGRGFALKRQIDAKLSRIHLLHARDGRTEEAPTGCLVP